LFRQGGTLPPFFYFRSSFSCHTSGSESSSPPAPPITPRVEHCQRYSTDGFRSPSLIPVLFPQLWQESSFLYFLTIPFGFATALPPLLGFSAVFFFFFGGFYFVFFLLVCFFLVWVFLLSFCRAVNNALRLAPTTRPVFLGPPFCPILFSVFLSFPRVDALAEAFLWYRPYFVLRLSELVFGEVSNDVGFPR